MMEIMILNRKICRGETKELYLSGTKQVIILTGK
jgi:hypothetical protein